MATQITQVDQPEQNRTVLRVEGDMLLQDAIVVERIAHCINEENGTHVAVDLADLDLLDSEAAAVLKRMNDLDDFEVEGAEIFLQSAVDLAERA